MLRGPNSFQLFPKIGKLNDGRLRSSKVSNRNADGVGRVSDRRRAARKSAGTVIAIDNVAGSQPLPAADLPEACVLLFGQEGPGLSPEALAAASGIVQIEQYGSTRSINAGAAAAVVMYEWCRRWA